MATCSYDDIKTDVPKSTYDQITEICTTQSEECKDAMGGIIDLAGAGTTRYEFNTRIQYLSVFLCVVSLCEPAKHECYITN